MKFKRFCLIIGLILQVVLLFSIDIPEPVGFVNDFANLLSEETRNKINDWAIELREKTDVDFVIVTLPDIGEMNEVDYGVKLYEKWKIGSKHDEGVLVLLALKERKLRFEVGYGSEGYLTDAYINQVYTTMKSYLSKGNENWDEAFIQGSLMLLSTIAKEKGVTLTGLSDYAKRKNTSSSGGLGIFAFLVIFVILIIVTRGRILEWLLWFSIFGGRGGGSFGGKGGNSWGSGNGGFGGFGGFGGGRSGGGGGGGGF
jgi:uncharacterized protein